MEKIHLFVDRSFLGKQRIVDLCESAEEMQKITVLQLKEKIAEQIPEYRRYVAGSKNVGLIFENKMLDEDSKPLSGYGIQHMSVVRLLLDFSGEESPTFHEGKEMEKDNTPTPKSMIMSMQLQMGTLNIFPQGPGKAESSEDDSSKNKIGDKKNDKRKNSMDRLTDFQDDCTLFGGRGSSMPSFKVFDDLNPVFYI